jgi:ubiquitin C-terminal hydrolase
MEKYVDNNEYKSYKYRLYAISNHTGTLDGGHYTAATLNFKSNKWHKFDDEKASQVHDTASLKSSMAYLLFYTRY